MKVALFKKVSALIAALAVAGAAAFLLIDGDEGSSEAPEPGPGAVIDALRASVPVDVRLERPAKPVGGPSYPLATVRHGQTISLRSSPGGRVVARVGDRTEFGSVRVFWIEKLRGAWFGVSVPELPDGRLAWVKDDRLALDLSQTRFWITANVSRQLLELHYGDRVLDSFPVTVGSPSSPTPLGDYSVTDGLVGRGLGPWYGCCVLALSGHQPNLPEGWIGGNRMAIHGTPGSIGGATSHGCLRASDRDMISLFARVPLGAPVFIRV
ncbi:MAG TPA: L,D-transpeptidase [Solirubrobacterales bacterium]|nr:L,D-transpeptidase [Solirubrobacterales bacterium]